MAGFGISLVGFIGVVSIICLLVAGIALLGLIQKAFDREGVVWGLISIFYPIGTYFYCRRNWDAYRGPFVFVTALVVTYLILWVIVRLV